MQHWIAEWRQRTTVIHVEESGHGEKDGRKFLVLVFEDDARNQNRLQSS